MPKKSRSYRRVRETNKVLLERILLLAAAVIVIVIIVAVLANQSTTLDVQFPARELGDANAKVVVETFSDFQCPICGVYALNIEPLIRQQYAETGKIKYLFRNFIVVDGYIAGGQESRLAALGALCAGDQGKYWEYHNLLYKNQTGENVGDFTNPRLFAFAMQLGLDGVAFDQCLNDQRHFDVIQADMRLGQSRGVNGTPTFFVNGQYVRVLHQNFQELFEAIDLAILQTGGA